MFVLASPSRPPPDRSRRPLPPEALSPPDPSRVATTVEKGHGRVEKRTLQTTSILTCAQNWKGAKQGFLLTRERTVGGRTTVEVHFGITSLSAERANATTLLRYVRAHWQIENELHYVRDVTLREDACRVRKGSSPQVLAAFRNALLYLLGDVGAKSHPEAIEILQANPERAKVLLGIT